MKKIEVDQNLSDDRSEVLNGRRPRGDVRLLDDLLMTDKTGATTDLLETHVARPLAKPPVAAPTGNQFMAPRWFALGMSPSRSVARATRRSM